MLSWDFQLSSCKKDDDTTPSNPAKKTYTVEYKATCIGKPLSQFTIYYVKSGTTYTQTVNLPSSQVSSDWTTSFTASTGDYVSIQCKPPSATGGYTQYVSLYIKYDGTSLASASAEWPSSAEAHGTLP